MTPDGLTFLRTERISVRCGPDPSSKRSFPDRASYVLHGKTLAYPEFETFVCNDFPMLRVCYPVGDATYDRIDLSFVWDTLRGVPDLGLVRLLLVLDVVHDEEVWIRQTTGAADLAIRALTDTRGHIKLFRPSDRRITCAAIRHEWSHLLKFASPEESGLFEALEDLEPLDPNAFLPGGQGAWTSLGDEVWAKLGETLLDGFVVGRQEDAKDLASAYPVRSALWGRAFAARRRKSGVTCPLDYVYDELDAWLRSSIRPGAVARLQDAAARSDLGRAARLMSLLAADG